MDGTVMIWREIQVKKYRKSTISNKICANNTFYDGVLSENK